MEGWGKSAPVEGHRAFNPVMQVSRTRKTGDP